MTAKERLHELVDELSELEADDALRALIARRKNGAASREPVAQSKKVGRLPFFGIGEGGPSDAARRVDELVGRAIDRRHTASSYAPNTFRASPCCPEQWTRQVRLDTMAG